MVALFDCVQFPRRGWVHRNQLPGVAGVPHWLTLPLAKGPVETRIADLAFAPDARETFAARCRAFPVLRERDHPVVRATHETEGDFVDYLGRLLELCCAEMGLQFNVLRTSRLSIDPTLRGQDRVLAIAQNLGATRYINLSGGKRLYDVYRSSFSGAYCECFAAKAAVADITTIETLSDPADLALNMYRPIEAAANTVRFKIYHAGSALALSDCLPMLENMGLKVVEERPYEIKRGANFIDVWLHDLLLIDAASEIDLGAIKNRFQDTFAGVWRGEIENDGFNQLVLRAGLSWREAVILRAYGKYLRQAGTAFSLGLLVKLTTLLPSLSIAMMSL